jgi:molybdopterin synthase catalytic subunit
LQTGVYPKGRTCFASIYADFVRNLGKDTGSVTSFLGVARYESADGKKKIRSLVMEAYEKHANLTLTHLTILKSFTRWVHSNRANLS